MISWSSYVSESKKRTKVRDIENELEPRDFALIFRDAHERYEFLVPAFENLEPDEQVHPLAVALMWLATRDDEQIIEIAQEYELELAAKEKDEDDTVVH